MRIFELNVVGYPRPQGSKRHVGNGVMVESSKGLKAWRDQLTLLAQQQRPNVPLDGPVSIAMSFRFGRPKAHYRSGKASGELKPNAPTYATSRVLGDGSKLQRAVEDALVDARWMTDDSLIADWTGEKLYVDEHAGEVAGVRIRVIELLK